MFVDAPAAGPVSDEEVFSDNAAERAAADNDGVKFAPVSADRLPGTIECFLQRIAEETAHVVEREACRFWTE